VGSVIFGGAERWSEQGLLQLAREPADDAWPKLALAIKRRSQEPQKQIPVLPRKYARCFENA
jgi:hypothetical protein